MLWLDFMSPLFFLSVSLAVTNAYAGFHTIPNRFSSYNSGSSPHYSSSKPTARHKNHCAYVVEKSVSYTVQDGVVPYVKAEYKKCGLGKKCPGLRYRMLYKPMFKVAYKTITELEWRCCPGFSGVGCNIGPPAYGMKAMPRFKGQITSYKGLKPSMKDPLSSYKGFMSSFKGPRPAFKGQMPPYTDPENTYEERVPFHKGQMPLFQGPMFQSNYNTNLWNQPLTPSGIMDENPGPNVAPSYPETSFEPYQEPETDHPDTVMEQHNPLINNQDSVHDSFSDHHEPLTNYQDPLPDHQQSIPHPEKKEAPETQASSGDSEQNNAVEENSVRVERLNLMEEDVQRLSLGLETLRAKVTSLEGHLRASLREDANHMLSTLLSATPIGAAPRDKTVGFGDLPGEAPDLEGSDAIGQFTNLGELAEKVAELHAEVLAKSSDIVELKKTVLDHEGALHMLSSGAGNLTDSQHALETLMETKFSKVGQTVLEDFDKRVKTAEQRCEDRVMEVHLQCKKELIEGQEQLEQVINGSVTALKMELANMYAEQHGQEPEDACCMAMSGITERLVLLVQSMDGLNQSQVNIQAELGGHKDHVEGMVEGRLAYVESLLSTTEKKQGSVDRITAGILENCLDDKMKDLEFRLFAAMEELGNATSPALVEGQTMLTLDTEVKSLKKRVEVDLDLFQKQLNSLELVCTSSCAKQPVLTGYAVPLTTLEDKGKETHENLNGQLTEQTERLDHLNTTLNSLIRQLSERQEEKELQGEVTLVKVNMRSINHTLCGLKDKFGKVVHEVGQTNLTWQEREERLAQQVKSVVQLVGRQASMLGAGERKLTRLKGELQDLRRRLASELQTCRSTALGVQKEVTDVGGRVARVEGQCAGLPRLAEDLELIRGELEKDTDGYFSQIKSTLVSHSLQLSKLKEGLKNCTKTSGLTGDHFMAVTQLWEEPPTAEPPRPRGDQFIEPTHV